MTIDFQNIGLPDEADSAGVSPATTIAFTEGPAATADGTIYFSDIANNRIMKFDSVAGTTSVFREPSGRANGLLFDPQGRLLACEGNEFGDNDGNRRITRTDLANGEVEARPTALKERSTTLPTTSPHAATVRFSSPIRATATARRWNWIMTPSSGSMSTVLFRKSSHSRKFNARTESR